MKGRRPLADHVKISAIFKGGGREFPKIKAAPERLEGRYQSMKGGC